MRSSSVNSHGGYKVNSYTRPKSTARPNKVNSNHIKSKSNSNKIISNTKTKSNSIKSSTASYKSTLSNDKSSLLSSVKNTIKKAEYSIKSEVKKTAVSLSAKVEKSVKNVPKTIKKEVSSAVKAAKQTASSIKGSINKAADKVSKTVSKVSSEAKKTAVSLSAKVEKSVKNVPKTAQKTVSDVKKHVDKNIGKGVEVLGGSIKGEKSAEVLPGVTVKVTGNTSIGSKNLNVNYNIFEDSNSLKAKKSNGYGGLETSMNDKGEPSIKTSVGNQKIGQIEAKKDGRLSYTTKTFKTDYYNSALTISTGGSKSSIFTNKHKNVSCELSLDTDTEKNTSGIRSKTSITVEFDRDKITKTAVTVAAISAAVILAPVAASVIAKVGVALAGSAAITSISGQFVEQFAY